MDEIFRLGDSHEVSFSILFQERHEKTASSFSGGPCAVLFHATDGCLSSRRDTAVRELDRAFSPQKSCNLRAVSS